MEKMKFEEITNRREPRDLSRSTIYRNYVTTVKNTTQEFNSSPVKTKVRVYRYPRVLQSTRKSSD